jgi:O-antigen/teichoic acid export membrane protein
MSSIYTATKKTKNSLWTSLIAAGANVILNIILIPKMGIQGAAVATMVSYGACLLVRIKDTRRLIPYKIDSLKMVVNFIALFMMCYVIIANVKLMSLYLIVCFFGVVILNSRELIVTVKKVLGK